MAEQELREVGNAFIITPEVWQAKLIERRNKMSPWLDRVLIIRHAVRDKNGQYDDEGHCESKIPFGGSIFWMGVKDGNGESMCAECSLLSLLHQLSITGTIPSYEDKWTEEWKAIQEKR